MKKLIFNYFEVFTESNCRRWQKGPTSDGIIPIVVEFSDLKDKTGFY